MSLMCRRSSRLLPCFFLFCFLLGFFCPLLLPAINPPRNWGFIFPWTGRIGVTYMEAVLRRFGCPDGVRVGWGVSEVQAAFVTTLAVALLGG